jgi:ribosomal protein S12 methylthiotransferase accessory factor
LARITPLLSQMGITRAADVTGLDCIGIPTWCAIRPSAKLVQVANGKGLISAAAKVSALMEAIELWHAENPAIALRAANAAELSRERAAYAVPSDLPEYDERIHLSERRVIDWVLGESLTDGAPVWLPAGTAALVKPTVMTFTTNGLASGNHLVEATLHALYEVVERDAVARFHAGGRFTPVRGESRIVDLHTLPAGPLVWLRDRITAAGARLVLVRADTPVQIAAFWAVLLDRSTPFACSSVAIGQGCHLSPTVAAIRAITEAAQGRLTFIHGSREDVSEAAYGFRDSHERIHRFFEDKVGDLAWHTIPDRASNHLGRDLDTVLSSLIAAGYDRLYRVDLTAPRFGIPVVKVIVPGLLHEFA